MEEREVKSGMQLVSSDIFQKSFPCRSVYLANEESAGLIPIYNFPPFAINIVNFWLVPAS
jgi:hypothetical protein